MSVNTSVDDNMNTEDTEDTEDTAKKDTVTEDVFLTTGYQELIIEKYELIIKDLKKEWTESIILYF